MKNSIFLIFLAICANFCTVSAEPQRILVVAPNFMENHFKTTAHLADLLVEKGKYHVHFLILNTANDKKVEHERKIGVKSPKFVPLNAHASDIPKDSHHLGTYEFVDFETAFCKHIQSEGDEEKLGNKWLVRGFTQHKRILENEAFTVFKEFTSSHKFQATMERLHRAKFQLGIFDTWDFGALYLFFLLAIPNTIGFNKFQLLSYQMKYAGTFDQLDTQKVPEVYATKIGDAFAEEKRREEFQEEHENSIALFSGVHNEMDVWFHKEKPNFVKKFDWLQNGKEWPKVADLYRGMKQLFVNSHPSIDFPLGEGMPKNMKYFGGIHLEAPLKNLKKENFANREDAHVVIFSLKYCGQMLDDKKENHKAFNAFIKAFEQFGKFEFIVDCEELEKNPHVNRKGPGAPRNIKFETVPKMQDKLANKNVRLLISNCGTPNVIEALAAGVPLICVPFFVDNYYTSEALTLDDAENGQYPVATTLDINKITRERDEAQIVDALKKMLTGESGKIHLQNARHIQERLQIQWEIRSPEKVFLEGVKNIGNGHH